MPIEESLWFWDCLLFLLPDRHFERVIGFHIFLIIKTKKSEQLEGQRKAAVLYVQGDAMCSLAIETVD